MRNAAPLFLKRQLIEHAVVHIEIGWLTNWYGRAKRYVDHNKMVKLLLAGLVQQGKRYKNSKKNSNHVYI